MMEEDDVFSGGEEDQGPTDTAQPAPPPPDNLTLVGLLEILNDAGMDYRLGKKSDEPEGKTFGASIGSGQTVFAGDPVTALLQAAAVSLRTEEAHSKQRAKSIADYERAAAVFKERIPEVNAYLPKGGKQKPCDTCGEYHGEQPPENVRRMRDIVQAALTGAGMAGPVHIERIDANDKKPPEN